VRLTSVLHDILAPHAYPENVARALGEAVLLTVLLGDTLKSGRLQLQTRTDGAVSQLVVDYEALETEGVKTPQVRAYAHFDADSLDSRAHTATLLGSGHLAFTIEQGDNARYQGLTALTGQGLETAAHEYFLASEQLPTRVRLCVGQSYEKDGAPYYCGGGILGQYLPAHGGIQDAHPGDAPDAATNPSESDLWLEARALLDTVEDIELLDTEVSLEKLLYRLFHAHETRTFPEHSVQKLCRCTDERLRNILESFSLEDRVDMCNENGDITMTCAFCAKTFAFAA
jgi:molecular chaperone Hsp33